MQRARRTDASNFDGIDSTPNAPSPAADGGGSFNPANFPRRLTTESLAALRRRRTGAARGVRRPLRQERRRRGDESESGSEYGSDEDDEPEGSLCDEICCCWGPRCVVAFCMLAATLAGWSAAITYGILRQPTYEHVVRPVRVARQHYLSKYWYGAPKDAEEGFILFDRDANGLIDVEDMRSVAFITTGERPSEEQLRAYIAKGDRDGDGKLDPDEYLSLLHSERAQKGGGGGGTEAGGGGAPGVYDGVYQRDA